MASIQGMSSSPTSTPSSPKSSIDRPRSKSGPAGHKKSPSANFFARIPFFRSTTDVPPPSPSTDDVIPFPDVHDHDIDDPTLPTSPALSSVFQSRDKARKRKSSLRKTALLGTGRLRLDRRFSGTDSTKSKSPLSPTKRRATDIWKHRHDDSSTSATPRASVDEDNVESAKSSLEELAPQDHLLKLETSDTTSGHLLSPLNSPTGHYASTTDEEDRFTTPSTIGSLSIPVSKPSPSPSPPSSESSLTNPPSLQLIRPSTKPTTTSPLSLQPENDDADDWDYSTTEWWGWIILLVTWIVFVVGMGSCLEVWSWAWDVGETPYAPPELEDDPTLPIVGYYPALMVLTAVMSWVWVVVAWMGMKYFKHAKIQTDDT